MLLLRRRAARMATRAPETEPAPRSRHFGVPSPARFCGPIWAPPAIFSPSGDIWAPRRPPEPTMEGSACGGWPYVTGHGVEHGSGSHRGRLDGTVRRNTRRSRQVVRVILTAAAGASPEAGPPTGGPSMAASSMAASSHAGLSVRVVVVGDGVQTPEPVAVPVEVTSRRFVLPGIQTGIARRWRWSRRSSGPNWHSIPKREKPSEIAATAKSSRIHRPTSIEAQVPTAPG